MDYRDRRRLDATEILLKMGKLGRDTGTLTESGAGESAWVSDWWDEVRAKIIDEKLYCEHVGSSFLAGFLMLSVDYPYVTCQAKSCVTEYQNSEWGQKYVMSTTCDRCSEESKLVTPVAMALDEVVANAHLCNRCFKELKGSDPRISH